jgi:hypothetical protein
MLRPALGLAAALLLGGATIPAATYDETGHSTVLYAVARRLEFSPEDAAILANSSQSLDEHDATTAFSVSKAGAELVDWASRKMLLEDAPHMRSGQTFHALTGHRAEVERQHQLRIARAVGSGNRKLALFYMGQYLHFEADSVVHPTDSLLGHFWERHHPDRGEENPAHLRAMMALVQQKMTEFKTDGVPRPTDPDTLAQWKKQPPLLDPVLEQVAAAVAGSWVPSRSTQARAALKSGSPSNIVDYDAMLDRAKAAVTRDRVMRVLSEASGSREFLAPVVYELDENGDPPLGSFATESDPQGFRRDISVLPFSRVVGELASLKDERARRIEELRQHVGAFASGMVGVAILGLPAGPGGVALDPGLDLPEGLGEFKELTLRGEDEVLLRTSTGPYRFEGLSARSFATILRTVAGGEIPFITIGTDPSTRPGYAKVTLAPSLKGTAEGAMLYRADLQLKAVFAGFALGDRQDLNLPRDPLFSGYPGIGGDRTRLWISSSGIRLSKEGDLLRVDRHGMRILSETRLMGDVVADPAMEAYVAKLTEGWDRISAQVSELKAMEVLALECALALWARRRQVPVNPFLWMLPARSGHTPEETPIVHWTGEEGGTCGGVTLAPEEEGRGPGKHFLRMISGVLGSPGLWAWAGLLLAGLVFGPALCLRLLLARAAKSSGENIALRAALKGWAWGLLGQILLALPAWPLVSSRSLAAADRDFVAFLWIAIAPLVFAAALRVAGLGALRSRTVGLHRLGLQALGLGLPLTASWAGILAALLTAGAMGTMITPQVESLITLELAPAGTFGAVAGCFVQTEQARTVFSPAPSSITFARREFQLAPPEDREAGPALVSEASVRDPFLPWKRLLRVHGVQGRAGAGIYTVDGRLPYDKDE